MLSHSLICFSQCRDLIKNHLLVKNAQTQVDPILPAAGIGAGVGVLAGGIYALSSPERRKNWFKNLLLYATLGALGGGALGFGVGSYLSNRQLKQLVGKQREDIERLTKSLQEKEEAVSDITRQMGDIASRIERTEQLLQVVSENSQVVPLVNTIVDLKQQTATLQNQLARLRDRLNRANEELYEAQMRINQLSCERDDLLCEKEELLRIQNILQERVYASDKLINRLKQQQKR